MSHLDEKRAVHSRKFVVETNAVDEEGKGCHYVEDSIDDHDSTLRWRANLDLRFVLGASSQNIDQEKHAHDSVEHCLDAEIDDLEALLLGRLYFMVDLGPEEENEDVAAQEQKGRQCSEYEGRFVWDVEYLRRVEGCGIEEGRSSCETRGKRS